MNRKQTIDTTLDGPAGEQRAEFDAHLNDCYDCQYRLCSTAEVMWRRVCVTSLRATARPKDGA